MTNNRPSASVSRQSLIKLLSNKPKAICSVTNIDFEQLQLRGYKNHFAILINDLFSETECQALLKAAEASNNNTWDQALVNVGNGEQMLLTDTRLCDRILWDDREVAAKILDRVMPHLPSDIVTLTNRPTVTGQGPVRRREKYRISRLNERLRFLRYTKGMYFRTHCDGSYVTPDGEEITFVTVHLYLNGGENPGPEVTTGAEDKDKPLLGGATRFLAADRETSCDVNPKTGSVLVFQHRNLMHSGEDVEQGTKYTLRSDILYRKVDREDF